MKTLALVISLAVTALPCSAQTAWITAGDAAYSVIRKMYPRLKPQESRAPSAGAEKVHLLEVKATDIDKITRTLHRQLRHCGGFMFHADEVAGRKALTAASVSVSPQTRPSYAIANQPLVAPMLVKMTDANLRETITGLTSFANRYYTAAPGRQASTWLKEKWEAVADDQDHISVAQYAHRQFDQRSVIATIEGSDMADQVVVLGAHLDTINILANKDTTKAPGADDDASGIAGLTEVLRVIAESGYKPRRTIKLIGYAAEEVGLRGSQEIADEYKRNDVNVVGVLQLDMINYKGSDSDIYIFTDHTDTPQNTFIASLVATYLPTLAVGYDKCGYACSDHASWNARGYATSMPFESEIRKDNPHIHTSRDTFENSGSQALHALKFARLAAAYAVELGSEAGPAQRTRPMKP